MAFPLVVNPRSGAVECMEEQFSQGLHIDINVTRTTRFGMMFPHNRLAGVEALSVLLPRVIDMSATVTHHFSGIGPPVASVQYVPSFPQLDRNSTTTPDAL